MSVRDMEGGAEGSSQRNTKITAMGIRGTKQRQGWGPLGPQPSSLGFTKLLLAFGGSGNPFKEGSVIGASVESTGHLGASHGSSPCISLGSANVGFSRQPGGWGVGPQLLGAF